MLRKGYFSEIMKPKIGKMNFFRYSLPVLLKSEHPALLKLRGSIKKVTVKSRRNWVLNLIISPFHAPVVTKKIMSPFLTFPLFFLYQQMISKTKRVKKKGIETLKTRLRFNREKIHTYLLTYMALISTGCPFNNNEGKL